MSTNDNFIKCPGCGEKINVNEVLTLQIETSMQERFKQQQEKIQRDFDQQAEALKKKEEDLKRIKDTEEQRFKEQVALERKKAEEEIHLRVQKELNAENSEKFQAMKMELDKKSEKVKMFGKLEADFQRLQREKNELQEEIIAETEKKFNETLYQEKIKIKKDADAAYELKILDLQKKLDEQTKLTDQMKKKQEQGSMQSQGEVQELAIEDFLTANFPYDHITEVKKGASGADCVHTVKISETQICGTIYSESKRTKNFSHAWVEKFKVDMQNKKVDIGVLVTEVLPSDMTRMGIRDGVYICTYEEFKGLSFFLREFLIRINNAQLTQENKGDKMELLYTFLTSDEFKWQIEGIVDAFRNMKTDLEKEKRAMHGIWAKREKQIDKVVLNTVHMHGAIRGIAGSAIKPIKELELDANLIEFSDEQ
jgi:hypothetical protein